VLPKDKSELVHLVVVANGSNWPIREVACKIEVLVLITAKLRGPWHPRWQVAANAWTACRAMTRSTSVVLVEAFDLNRVPEPLDRLLGYVLS
jgi:hypothetical protein